MKKHGSNLLIVLFALLAIAPRGFAADDEVGSDKAHAAGVLSAGETPASIPTFPAYTKPAKRATADGGEEICSFTMVDFVGQFGKEQYLEDKCSPILGSRVKKKCA